MTSRPGIQGLVVLACVPVKYLLYVMIVQNVIPDYRPTPSGRILVGSFITEVTAFAAMFAVIHAVELSRRTIEQREQAARLEARLIVER